MMSFAIMTILSLTIVGSVSGDANSNETNNSMQGELSSASDTGKNHILVAYFSHSGNTRVIANQIHEKVGGDIFEIKTVDPYPDNYDAVVEKAKKELSDGYRPALDGNVKNMESYDVIFLGYPIWWSTMPMAVESFLTEYDLSGKTIVPFCTHGGSRLGSSVGDIKNLCPQSKILDGLAVSGSDVNNAENDVSEWLVKNGISQEK